MKIRILQEKQCFVAGLEIRVQALGCCAGLTPTEGAAGLDKSSGAAFREQAPGSMCWL